MAESNASPADSRATLDALKLARLRRLLHEILPGNTFYATKFARIPKPTAIESLDALTEWPFTFKDELVEASSLAAAGDRPGGPGNLTYPVERYVRYHQTSGTHGRPLPVFDTAEDWQWWMDCWRIVFERGRVQAGDRVFVASSFGPYVGFWSAFDAAPNIGAMAIPSGGLSTVARLDLLRTVGATVLVATPSYALHLAEVARDQKIDTAALPVRLVIVAGEPGGSSPSVRSRLAEAWGAAVLDHAGATEVGPWGVGDLQGHGLDVIEPWFHAEFLAVETGLPAAAGQLAELVLTTLGRAGAPVIRYRTGDLVRPRWPADAEVAAGSCPWVRLDGGVLGRVDDMLIIRGVNVFPGAIDDIVRSFPEIVEYRLTVANRDSLDTMLLEIEDHLDDPGRVAMELQLRLGLRVEVMVAPLGSLPRFESKGRRISDQRPHVTRRLIS